MSWNVLELLQENMEIRKSFEIRFLQNFMD